MTEQFYFQQIMYALIAYTYILVCSYNTVHLNLPRYLKPKSPPIALAQRIILGTVTV